MFQEVCYYPSLHTDSAPRKSYKNLKKLAYYPHLLQHILINALVKLFDHATALRNVHERDYARY